MNAPAKGLLSIETLNKRVLFEGDDLGLKQKWWSFVALLGLTRFEGQSREITAEDIHHLPDWSHMKLMAVRTGVFRHLQHHPELRWIASPPGEATKRFFLDPNTVKRVQCDVSPQALRKILLPNQPSSTPSPDQSKITLLLTRAQVRFERGVYPEVLELCEQIQDLKPTPAQHLRMLALIAWVKLYNSSKSNAWQAVKTMQRTLEQTLQDGTLHGPEAKREQANVWLQVARFHTSYQEQGKAQKAMAWAEPLLEPWHHQELGVIAFMRGLFAQREGDLLQAELWAAQSLEHHRSAQWRWGIVAQSNNVAVIKLLRSEQAAHAGRLNQQVLLEAIDLLEESHALSRDNDLNSGSNHELNISFAYRMLDDLPKAQQWLEKGSWIINTVNNPRDYGEYHAEKAELELALGNHETGLEQLRVAEEWLVKGEADAWLEQVRHRLDEVQRNVQGSKPLKLW